MLDTVVILISWGDYRIWNHNKFKPTTEGLAGGKYQSGMKFINNAMKAEKKKYYYPRMTIYTEPHYQEIKILKVEFSVSKLLTGESVNEYGESQYMDAVENLKQRMYERGVFVSKKSILNASVVAFHVAKNIPLRNGYTVTFALKELSKIDISKRIDVNKADFRNGGHAYQFYTNSYSFVMYDKIADLNKGKGRAIDKDNTPRQLSVFKEVDTNNKGLQLLRLEFRISKKKYINKILEGLGYDKNPKFKDILTHALSKEILNFYWNKFFDNRNKFVLDMDNEPLSILKRTLHQDSKIKVRKAMQVLAFHLLAKDAGMRDLRSVLEAYRPNTDWNSLKRDLKVYESPPFPIRLYGFVDDIERELQKFKPYRLP